MEKYKIVFALFFAIQFHSIRINCKDVNMTFYASNVRAYAFTD